MSHICVSAYVISIISTCNQSFHYIYLFIFILIIGIFNLQSFSFVMDENTESNQADANKNEVL